jgi:hypothetical protein
MLRWILAALAVPVFSAAIWAAYARLVINSPERGPTYAVGQTDHANYEAVPLVRLLATPERYDGRRVRVEGYLTLGFEDAGLHPDRTSYEGGLRKNAMWVDRPTWLTRKDEQKLTRRYAEVAGVFDADGEGHLGLYSGALTEVRGIGRLLTHQEYERMRLRWPRHALFERVLSPFFLATLGWTGLAIFWLARRLAK